MAEWKRRGLLVAACALCAMPIAGRGEPRDEGRGALLYGTYCESCHTTEVHWREKKLATDWPALVAQVRRWQANAALGWGEGDIAEVARYLDGRFYRFGPAQGGR